METVVACIIAKYIYIGCSYLMHLDINISRLESLNFLFILVLIQRMPN